MLTRSIYSLLNPVQVPLTPCLDWECIIVLSPVSTAYLSDDFSHLSSIIMMTEKQCIFDHHLELVSLKEVAPTLKHTAHFHQI